MTLPASRRLTLPSDYGKPTHILEWKGVARRIEEAPRYWLVTVRADGRPHVVPTDGVWADEGLYVGGSPATVHYRNMLEQPQVAVHLEDGEKAVVVEGRARLVTPDRPLAKRLAAASNAKTGYGAPVEMFLTPLWRIEPRTAMAWNAFPTDATSFSFGD